MSEILTITAEVDITNGIIVADVCDSIIEQMKALKEHALQECDSVTMRTGNIEIEPDGELVGDWVIESRKRGRR